MWHTILGLFLVAHGLVTVAIWGPRYPAAPEGQLQPPDPAHSWIFGDVRTSSLIFGVLVGLALALAGFGFLTDQTWGPRSRWAPASRPSFSSASSSHRGGRRASRSVPGSSLERSAPRAASREGMRHECSSCSASHPIHPATDVGGDAPGERVLRLDLHHLVVAVASGVGRRRGAGPDRALPARRLGADGVRGRDYPLHGRIAHGVGASDHPVARPPFAFTSTRWGSRSPSGRSSTSSWRCSARTSISPCCRRDSWRPWAPSSWC